MEKALKLEAMPELKSLIQSSLEDGATKIAAFDADGTLWDTDIGENFFKYQVKNKLVEGLPDDPWNFYQKWHEKEPLKAYLWLAQINKGVPITTVREWAKAAVDESGELPVFKHMAELIETLKDQGINVYVVTASVKWAVEPAAAKLGIPQENVLGIETIVDGSIVTDIQKGPITWRAGKAEALQEKTQNKRPLLAAGNTLGDVDLISTATHIPIAHTSVSQKHAIYNSERNLLDFAKERGWYYLDLL